MLLTRTDAGTSPLTTAAASSFLKVASGSDDTQIAALTAVAVEFCESYTGRSVRESTYEQLQTGFGINSEICIRQGDVASISKVEYLVSSVWTTVADTVYQFVRGTFDSRIVLRDGQEWPSDEDTQEQNVRITFLTEPLQQVDVAVAGIQRHLALLYADRGDMEAPQLRQDPGSLGTSTNVADTARQSGATGLYELFARPGVI